MERTLIHPPLDEHGPPNLLGAGLPVGVGGDDPEGVERRVGRRRVEGPGPRRALLRWGDFPGGGHVGRRVRAGDQRKRVASRQEAWVM